MSKDLHESDKAIAFEQAKGLSQSIERRSFLLPLSNNIVEARDELIAKRKLTLIRRSETSVSDISKSIGIGDPVEVFVKYGADKREGWLSSRSVILLMQMLEPCQFRQQIQQPFVLLSKLYE